MKIKTSKPTISTQVHMWNQRLSVNEYRQRRLTFGRHRGLQIKDLPRDYLVWGIMNLDRDWADQFSRELQHREPKWRKA